MLSAANEPAILLVAARPMCMGPERITCIRSKHMFNQNSQRCFQWPLTSGLATPCSGSKWRSPGGGKCSGI